MSAAATLPRPAALAAPARGARATATQSLPGRSQLALAAGAFFALALLAALRFAALLEHPLLLRALAVAATASAVGAAIARTGAGGASAARRAPATAARGAILLGGGWLSLRAAGVGASLAWPGGWPALARELARGARALDGLWPYRGGAPPARLAVMAVLPATTLPAAALAFWPGHRHATARRTLAMATLLCVYLLAAVNEPGRGWQTQGTLLAASLFAWGWAWRAQRPRQLARGLVWALAAGAAALAAASPLAGSTPLLDYRAWNPFGPAYAPQGFDWDQTYGPLAWPQTSEPMVSVTSASREPLRAAALARFDGYGFVRSTAQPVRGRSTPQAARHPRWVTHARITVLALSSSQLLSPGEVLHASIAGSSPPRLGPVAPDGTVGLAAGTLAGGTRYTVTAYAPRPSAAEMRRAPRALPAAYLPYTELELPGDPHAQLSAATAAGAARIERSPYGGVYALARRLAAGAAGAYEVVARVDAFLHHGFSYYARPPRTTYPLVSFLLRERSGYCQQFSGAMALMLRMDGIPARVAAGFLPGPRDGASHSFQVTAADAHDWVEVHFAGIGWVPFDPTPARAAGGGFDLPARPRGSAAPARHAHAHAAPAGAAGGAARASAHGGGGFALAPAALLPAGALALALAGAAATLLVRARRAASRVDRRRAGPGDGVERDTRELARTLARLGVPLAAGVTLYELERQLLRSHGPDAGAYARLLRERRYGPPAHAAHASGGAGERRRLRRALARGRGPLGRVRALLALPPKRARRA
ncbi:MAG TPA: transglutaminase-like domain-containing protein [Solirubrobacteraceae bacterium]|nr:transglutaminase-like domain-containing protein [Solirubrobacteraceae bacterium]